MQTIQMMDRNKLANYSMSLSNLLMSSTAKIFAKLHYVNKGCSDLRVANFLSPVPTF